jgi:hypothetical protein
VIAMGLLIELQDEQGKMVEQLADPKNLLHRLLPSHEDSTFECLRYVDLYQNTTFNQLQCGAILHELQVLMDGCSSRTDDYVLLSRLLSLARHCHAEPHLYLKFYGD